MKETQMLRPIERRILKLAAAGVDETEIARRFRRSPRWVASITILAGLPRRPGCLLQRNPLRPIERRVLRWRNGGAAPSEIGVRFHRSAAFIQQVEALARYKLRVL
ncbi:MAG: hypothetical protein ACRDV9_04245 [Acidimicrobiia bacterium]